MYFYDLCHSTCATRAGSARKPAARPTGLGPYGRAQHIMITTDLKWRACISNFGPRATLRVQVEQNNNDRDSVQHIVNALQILGQFLRVDSEYTIRIYMLAISLLITYPVSNISLTH